MLACRLDEAGGHSDGAYTLLEAAVLARSSVAGQRAAALRLLAGALEQARQKEDVTVHSGFCCGVQGVGSGRLCHASFLAGAVNRRGGIQGLGPRQLAVSGFMGVHLSSHELAWCCAQGGSYTCFGKQVLQGQLVQA